MKNDLFLETLNYILNARITFVNISKRTSTFSISRCARLNSILNVLLTFSLSDIGLVKKNYHPDYTKTYTLIDLIFSNVNFYDSRKFLTACLFETFYRHTL